MKSGKRKHPSQPDRAPTRSVARKINGKLQITAFNLTRHLRPTCGAQAKSTGELCRDIPMANGRCYRHGGRTPKGKNWHLPVWPDGNAPGAMDKVDRKLRDLQRAAKRREKRIAAMSPEERADYEKWKRAHKPGSPADRARARAERKQNAATRAFLAQDAAAAAKTATSAPRPAAQEPKRDDEQTQPLQGAFS